MQLLGRVNHHRIPYYLVVRTLSKLYTGIPSYTGIMCVNSRVLPFPHIQHTKFTIKESLFYFNVLHTFFFKLVLQGLFIETKTIYVLFLAWKYCWLKCFKTLFSEIFHFSMLRLQLTIDLLFGRATSFNIQNFVYQTFS